MIRKLRVPMFLPILIAILFFSFGFSQVMLVQYGQEELIVGKSIHLPVSITYPEDINYPIDCMNPNEADIKTLCLLPGVGKVTAQAFHDEIALNGPFYYPEDILAVKGIGEKKLEDIRPLIRLY